MRKYQAEQIAEKEKPKPTEHAKPAFSPFGNPAGFLDAATASKFAKERKDPELERQRREARPPMLGQDIKFPRCESPEPSRFDPTQGCDAVRTAMCYLSEQSKAASEKGESLRASSTLGLWGGFCPNTEIPIPFPLPHTFCKCNFAPSDFAGIDEKLAVEQSIEEEFGDDFVTRTLRLLKKRACVGARLRIDIKEWARQHPNMADEDLTSSCHGTVAIRRGSWAQ
ncbi:hypothetical protein J3E74DRAFT_397046 [Bipolaris maydis]|nr:hypothetical protein J3E74DRAFT_397046 [Bipolaris maydis]